MLTIRFAGGMSVSCASPQGSLLAFPSETSKKPLPEKTFVLCSVPEDSQSAQVISWPGEYDYGGISLRGIGQATTGDRAEPLAQQVSYVATVEGIRCGFFSSPLRPWSEHEIELLGDLDVLLIPCDDPKLVQHLVEEVDPRVVIPLPGKDPKAYQESLRACGAAGKEAVSEVKLKKSSLPAETREVYVLEAV